MEEKEETYQFSLIIRVLPSEICDLSLFFVSPFLEIGDPHLDFAPQELTLPLCQISGRGEVHGRMHKKFQNNCYKRAYKILLCLIIML